MRFSFIELLRSSLSFARSSDAINKLSTSFDSLPKTKLSTILSWLSIEMLPFANISEDCEANKTGNSITKSTPFFTAKAALCHLSKRAGPPL